ncbi:MAG: aromatic ring-hydroxylating dioxygenase subunit alpha [Marinilabiliales bacterium]|nr:aromatic ring-hydroxylating dioxygenase subunit alpha [Marinilabiliales bacterium]
MIPNQWYVVLDSSELKKKRPLRVQRLGVMLAFWRDESGKANCIADKCCHRGASLGCGTISKGHLVCPFHGFEFGGDGKVVHIPANGRLKPVPETMRVEAYPVWEGYGLIWIWWGEASKATDKPFFFAELADFSYSTLIDRWKVHYSRVIENQLDVVHLPFVHATTIGRGGKTLVNGPVVRLEGELITFWVQNIRDDGNSLPRKEEAMPDYEKLFRLQFHYPNIWQNFISDKIRAFAAFVPVDEETTLVYIRYYQRMIRLPLLRNLFNYIGKISSLVILRQDKRVVETQLPLKSEQGMDERLIQGDKPIVVYRKHRQELIRLAEAAINS